MWNPLTRGELKNRCCQDLDELRWELQFAIRRRQHQRHRLRGYVAVSGYVEPRPQRFVAQAATAVLRAVIISPLLHLSGIPLSGLTLDSEDRTLVPVVTVEALTWLPPAAILFDSWASGVALPSSKRRRNIPGDPRKESPGAAPRHRSGNSPSRRRMDGALHNNAHNSDRLQRRTYTQTGNRESR